MVAGLVLVTVTLSNAAAMDINLRIQSQADTGWHEWSEAHEIYNPNHESRGLFALITRRMVRDEPRLSITVARPLGFDHDSQSTWLEHTAADSLIEGLAMAYRAIWGRWPRFMKQMCQSDNGGA